MSTDHDDWAEPVEYVGRRGSGGLGSALAQTSALALDVAPIQFQPRRAPVPPRTTSLSLLDDHIERLHRMTQPNVATPAITTTPVPDEPDFSEFEQIQSSAPASLTPRRVRMAKLEKDVKIIKRPKLGNDSIVKPRTPKVPLSQMIAADIHAVGGSPLPKSQIKSAPLSVAIDPIKPIVHSPTLIASQHDGFDRIEPSQSAFDSPTVKASCGLGKRPSWLNDFDDELSLPSPRPTARRRSEADSLCDSGHRPKRSAVGELRSRLKLIECRLVSSRTIFHNNVASSYSGLDMTTIYLILSDIFYTRFDLHLCYCRSRTQDGASDELQVLISDDEWHASALHTGSLIRISSRNLKMIWHPPNDLPVIAATSISVETQISDELRQWIESHLTG